MSNIPKFIKDYYESYIGGGDIETWWDNSVDLVLQNYFIENTGDELYEWDDIKDYPNGTIIKKITDFHSKYVLTEDINEWYKP